ncbi:MAG: hypothetical protein ACYC1M_12045 [Armatimonadota bacterium]
METNEIGAFLHEHKDMILMILISLLTTVKITAWGRGQAQALDTVIGVIEQVGAGDVKGKVADTSTALASVAKDAIRDSVAKADPKKTERTVVNRILTELFRRL